MLEQVERFKQSLRNFLHGWREASGEQARLRLEHARILEEIRAATPDNPALHGFKVYSQCDEDGIVSNIFSRIGHGDRIFVEIGCSDGLENNTHALLLQDWRGVWVDASARKLDAIEAQLPTSDRLVIRHCFVDKSNAAMLLSETLGLIRAATLDFLSIDIDGDDLGVALAILEGHAPRVLCIEYNSKFPPPIRVAMKLRTGSWSGNDYHGASLAALVEALKEKSYRLVCCNASGTNAFFVRSELFAGFTEYSTRQLYRPAAYDLRRLRSGHRPSLHFLTDRLADQAEPRS